jgi:chromosome segregation ATPase
VKYLIPLMLLLLPSCLATSGDLERIRDAFDSTIVETAKQNEANQRDLMILQGELAAARKELGQADAVTRAKLEAKIQTLEAKESDLEERVAGAVTNLSRAGEEFGEDIEAIAEDVRERYEAIMATVRGPLGTGPVGVTEAVLGLAAGLLGLNTVRNKSREQGKHLPPTLTETKGQ